MSPFAVRHCLGLVAVSWLALGRVASAQEPGDPRPYLGLFPQVATGASPAARPSPRSTTDLFVQTFEEVERVGVPPGSNDQPLGRSQSFFGGIRADLRRSDTGSWGSYGIGTGVGARYDPAAGGLRPEDYSVEADVRSDLTARTGIVVSQRVRSSRAYPFGVTLTNAGTSGEVTSGRMASGLASFVVGSTASLSRHITRRTVMQFGYSFDRVVYADSGIPVSSHHATGELQRSISRGLSIHVGYGSVWSDSGLAGGSTTNHSHQIAFGGEYQLPSFRTTTVTAGVAPSLSASTRFIATGPPGASGPKRAHSFALEGLVRIDHRFSSGSSIGLGYQRTSSDAQSSNEPVLADVLTGRLEGHLGDRLVARLDLFHSRGRPRIQQQAETSVSASARVDLQVSSTTYLYAEYVRDDHTGAGGVSSLPGLARPVERQRVQLGVKLDIKPWTLARRDRHSSMSRRRP